MIKGFDKYIHTVLKSIMLYKYDLQKFVYMFGCSSEAELFAGKIVLEDQNSLRSKIDGKPIFWKQPSMMVDYLRVLFVRHRALFNLGIENKPPEERRKKAAALYFLSHYNIKAETMTHQKFKNPKYQEYTKKIVKYMTLFQKFDDLNCFSLPWIVAGQELIDNKLSKLKGKEYIPMSAISNLGDFDTIKMLKKSHISEDLFYQVERSMISNQTYQSAISEDSKHNEAIKKKRA